MDKYFSVLANYNAWANGVLLQDAAKAGADELNADQGANFSSIMGILNHLILADRLWLFRFTGQGEAPSSVGGIPFPDFVELTSARRELDARIVKYASTLTEEILARQLHFTTTEGVPFTESMRLLLVHFFNHQTHHRGQIHALLGRLGVTPRDLDLAYFMRERAH